MMASMRLTLVGEFALVGCEEVRPFAVKFSAALTDRFGEALVDAIGHQEG